MPTATAEARPPQPSPEPPATLAGRITDLARQAVAGASVKLVSGSRTYNEGRTDADGRYRIADVRPGRYRVLARAPGFLDGAAPGTVVLAPAQALGDVDVALKPSGLVTGRVADPSGAALAGARVWTDRGGAYGRVETRADAAGRFELRGLPAGRSRLFAADAWASPRWLPSKPLPIDVPKLDDGSPGAVEGVEIVLLRGAMILGGVTLPDGSSVFCEVWLHDARGKRLRKAVRAESMSDGFLLDALAAGAYQLVAGPVQGAIARASVTLAPEEIGFVSLALAGGGSLAGACVDSEGAPVAGARVTAAAQGIAYSPAATTGADGRFRIGGLLDAAYVLTVKPPEGYAPPAPLEVDVAAGAGPQDLAFELASGAALAGRAVAVDGGPAGGAQVTVFPAARPGEQVTVAGYVEADPAGRFRLPRLPPGDLDIFVRAGAENARLSARVAAGEERALDVQLAPMARIRGAVRLASGAGAAGAQVDVRSVEGAVRRSARTGRNGAFDVRDLYPGRYAVSARLGAAAGAVEVDLGASQTIDGLELALR